MQFKWKLFFLFRATTLQGELVAHAFHFWCNPFNQKLYIFIICCQGETVAANEKRQVFNSKWLPNQNARTHTHCFPSRCVGFVYDFVKLSAESGFAQQMNFIAVLSNHICDLWTASACTIFNAKLCIEADVSFSGRNVQIGVLSHADTIHPGMYILNECKQIHFVDGMKTCDQHKCNTFNKLWTFDGCIRSKCMGRYRLLNIHSIWGPIESIEHAFRFFGVHNRNGVAKLC